MLTTASPLFSASAADAGSRILLPALRWQVDISAAPAIPPLVSDGYVYLSLKPGVVAAHRVKDGQEAWSVRLAVDQEPASDAELLLVPAAEAIHALRTETGQEAWLAATGTVTAPLLVQGGWLIAAAGGGVAAYRASDGTEVWKKAVGEVREQPTIDGDALFVSFTDGRITCFDLSSGEERWVHKLNGAGRKPLVLDERVYVGSDDKSFYALKVRTGEQDWVMRIGAPPIGRAAADRKHVYFAAMDNMVRAVDRIHGALRWRKELTFRPNAGPRLIGEAVLVPGASDALQYVAAADGRALSEVKLEGGLATPPGVGTEAGETLASVAAVTGGLADRWKLWLYGPLPPPPEGPPIQPLSVLPGLLVRLGM